jgi:hypothetical protein
MSQLNERLIKAWINKDVRTLLEEAENREDAMNYLQDVVEDCLINFGLGEEHKDTIEKWAKAAIKGEE